jgi:hypothetical protein
LRIVLVAIGLQSVLAGICLRCGDADVWFDARRAILTIA